MSSNGYNTVTYLLFLPPYLDVRHQLCGDRVYLSSSAYAGFNHIYGTVAVSRIHSGIATLPLPKHRTWRDIVKIK